MANALCLKDFFDYQGQMGIRNTRNIAVFLVFFSEYEIDITFYFSSAIFTIVEYFFDLVFCCELEKLTFFV